MTIHMKKIRPARIEMLDGIKVKIIPLTRGYETIVDEEDYFLFHYNWWARGWKEDNFYACTWIKKKIVKLQNLLLPPKEGFVVDHKNRNSLDNRKQNLRYATLQQNNANNSRAVSDSGFKGVYPRVSGNWRAQVTINGQLNYLGTFSSKEEAALVYDKAAKIAFGEFARLNFPEC